MLFLVNPLVSHAANRPGLDVNRNRIYNITSAKSGLVMTQDAEGKMVQKSWTESDDQKWKIIPESGGVFKIECVADGKALDVPGNSTEDLVQLIAGSPTSNPNQQWRLVEQEGGSYRIEAVHSGKVIDVHGGSIEEGATLIQFGWHGGDNQKWILSEVRPKSELFDKKVTVYQDANYGGASQILGPGKYDIGKLSFGNDQISSLKVPEGLRVTLFEHANFRGNHKMLISDTSYVGDSFNDKTSAILVEKVASFYTDGSYQGQKLVLGIGRYNLADIEALGNDRLSSVKVPQGLQVTLYQHGNFQGNYLVLDQDEDFLGPYNFNDIASSIVVKATGIVVPDDVLTYGSTISLKSHHGRWMSAYPDGQLDTQPQNRSWEKFTVVRAGASKHNSLVSYGDIIALKGFHGKYVTAIYESGQMVARSENLQGAEKFIITRAGQSESNIFVSKDDVIALKTLDHNLSVTALDNSSIVNRYDYIQAWEQWTVDTAEIPPEIASAAEAGDGCGAAASIWSTAGVGVCGAAVCVADACGAAACGAAALLFAACGAAATGIAACGVAAAGAAACAADFCGGAVGGLTACGGDACGAAACGAAACGAAACGAAACGAAAGGITACGGDACGAAASGIGANVVGACAAEAGGIDACVADACAANACGINLCPADACAADACAIDVIPIIPFI
ncbi:MAG: RICIN domain-containing protein [Crocosphaera sp.]